METERNGTLDLDLVRHSSEARVALVLLVSIEDRPLLWILVRSQTNYPEHILAYGSWKARCSLTWVPVLTTVLDHTQVVPHHTAIREPMYLS